MKKRISISFSLMLIALAIFLLNILIPRVFGRRPFKNLTLAQISSASVTLTPPGRTVEEIDVEELVGYLHEVVVYQKDNSYVEYSGQGVTFTLRYQDGTQRQVMAYNPFVVIDGTGYRCKYEPCQALSGFANRLLEE